MFCAVNATLCTHPHDGRDELDKESGNLEQGRVEVVEEVDEQSLDMRTVVILDRCKKRKGAQRVRTWSAMIMMLP